jgi:hypothetical protein
VSAHVGAGHEGGLADVVGWWVGDGAGLDVGLDFYDAVAARIANEFLAAPIGLSFDPVLVMTGGGD